MNYSIAIYDKNVVGGSQLIHELASGIDVLDAINKNQELLEYFRESFDSKDKDFDEDCTDMDEFEDFINDTDNEVTVSVIEIR